jgi:hypothetical protein
VSRDSVRVVQAPAPVLEASTAMTVELRYARERYNHCDRKTLLLPGKNISPVFAQDTAAMLRQFQYHKDSVY